MEDFNRYIPHTEEDVRKMLEAIGLKKVEDLFRDHSQRIQAFETFEPSRASFRT